MSLRNIVFDQTMGMVCAGTSLTLMALHPFVHHLENGALDSILTYVHAASLDAMNRNN